MVGGIGEHEHLWRRAFLKWAVLAGRCPRRLRDPKDVRGDGRVLAQAGRMALLGRLLDPNTGPIPHRAAGIVLPLLGQPFTRTSVLTNDDISADDDSPCVYPQGPSPSPDPSAQSSPT